MNIVAVEIVIKSLSSSFVWLTSITKLCVRNRAIHELEYRRIRGRLNIENTKNRSAETGRTVDRVSIYPGTSERNAHTRTLNTKNIENR